MFKYQDIIDKLPVAEIQSAIDEMIRSYDIKGIPYVLDNTWDINYEGLFNNYFNQSQEFNEIVEKTISKEYEEDKERAKYGIFSLEFFDGLHESSYEEYKKRKKEEIFKSLLEYLDSEAKRILENRENLRISSGDIVDFKQCIYSYNYRDKIEFYKDGGWGIAEEDGTVIIKNHLMKQPSHTSPIKTNSNCPYRIIQDRDTKKYGVLSVLPFYEAIHCCYDKIEIIEYYIKEKKHFYLKVLYKDKWGCFDENCALLIECRYDDIKLNCEYFECTRNSNYLIYDRLGGCGYDGKLEGKIDLYNSEGSFLLGGFDYLNIEGDYLKFYFGSSYEYYHEDETDLYDQTYKLSKLRLNFGDSICLVLDKSFRSIIKNKDGFYKLPKGLVFDSKEDLIKRVPSDYLFKYRVDLSDINDGYIYLHDSYGEFYTVPFYIVEGFGSPEELEIEKEKIRRDINSRAEELHKLLGFYDTNFIDNTDIQPIIYGDYTHDKFIDNPIVTIIKCNENKDIEWVDYVNEIEKTNYTKCIFKKGCKYGFYDDKGLSAANFDAITTETPDGKIYIAMFEYNKDPRAQFLNNPNYKDLWDMFIRFYSIEEDGELTRIEDNWDVFDPTKCKWFPHDFIEIYYDGYSGESPNYNHGAGHEWTDEDAWDAMTDGMYGDYPGSGWDPEMFGY